MPKNISYLVTGANRGIGRGLVAAFLARPHATVIAAVRDPEVADRPVTDAAPIPRIQQARRRRQNRQPRRRRRPQRASAPGIRTCNIEHRRRHCQRRHGQASRNGAANAGGGDASSFQREHRCPFDAIPSIMAASASGRTADVFSSFQRAWAVLSRWSRCLG